MPVGTNGCPQGSWQPGQRHFCQALSAKVGGMPGLPVRSRIPSQPGEQSAGQARTGTGAVRSRDCLDAQVATPREDRQNPATR
jgi:hypothetical protein